MRLGNGVIDVGTQRVKRRPSFLVAFGTSHLGTAQTTGNLDLDPFGAKTHGAGHAHLRCPAERYPAFNLAGNAVGNQPGIELRTLYFEDVDLDLLLRKLLQLFLQLVDLFSAFPDNDTRARGVDGNSDEL